MTRNWGTWVVVAAGVCVALPASGEDLFQAPTVSPPTDAAAPGVAAPGGGYAAPPAAGYGGFGVAPLAPAVAPPPAVRPWYPMYNPPPPFHPLAGRPFGEPVVRPDDGRHHGHHGYGRGDCDGGSCDSGSCDSGHCNRGPDTCWINEQYEPEWYVAPMIGYHDLRTMNCNVEGFDLKTSPKGGLAGSAAAGWASGIGMFGRHRFEVEFAVRSSDLDKCIFGTLPVYFEGDISSLSLMANLYWDFKHSGRNWYPYVGVGVGGSHVNIESNFAPFGNTEIDDNVYALQLMAGSSYKVRPYLELFAEAKYFHTDSLEFSYNTTAATFPNGIVMPAGEKNLTAGYHTFGVMFGARILLGKRTCDTLPAADGRATSGGGWTFHPF